MIILINAEKHLMNPTSNQDKNSQQSRNRKGLPQLDKEHP